MIYAIAAYLALVLLVALWLRAASDREVPRRVPLCPSCREAWDADVDCDMIGHTRQGGGMP